MSQFNFAGNATVVNLLSPVSAASYVQRIERRKDLQLTAGWRLVPSV